LPAADPKANRTLYFYRGNELQVAGQKVSVGHAIVLGPGGAVDLVANAPAELLLLQGRPIGEPVVQYGPFVMNTRAEIQQAVADYQRTQFGGWPWPEDDPVQPRTAGRNARHADGRVEQLG